MTWTVARGALHVFFNRDEKRTRLIAEPPASRRTSQGTSYLSPLDGDRGGTWIAANEHGLVAGLLNYYQADTSHRSLGTSRGEIPILLMDARTIEEVQLAVQPSLAACYRPFLLIVLDSAGNAKEFTWNGHDLSVRDLFPKDLPITTSSFETEPVTRYRRELLVSLLSSASAGLTSAELQAYHLQPGPPGKTAYGVCMSRPDAQSVSLTHIRIEYRGITMDYSPLSEGSPGPLSTTTLPR
jgi:hypothetical protein